MAQRGWRKWALQMAYFMVALAVGGAAAEAAELKFGGYAKLDLIFRRYQQNQDLADPGTVPIKGNDPTRFTEFRMHARQTRLNLTLTEKVGESNLKGFVEGDFFGITGTQTVSNSDSFRLRHAFGEVSFPTGTTILAGQFWSGLMTLPALFDVVDFNGPTGSVFVRQAQLKVTQKLSPSWAAVFSVENPEFFTGSVVLPSGTSFGAVAGSGGGAGGATSSTKADIAPDLVGKIVWTHPRWGTVEARGLLRFLRAKLPVSGDSDVGVTGAGGLAGRVNLWKQGEDRELAVLFESLVGTGLGRYTLALGPDAIVQADGDVEGVLGATGTAGFEFRATKQLKFHTVFGWEVFQSNKDVANGIGFGLPLRDAAGAIGSPGTGGGNQRSLSVHAGAWYKLFDRYRIGLEYIWMQRRIFGAAAGGDNQGDNHSVQGAVQFFF
ncbi:MAG: hypothetical protein HY713_07020 [candidate division NC10 bacterium]|nr:hypothetical protein [candidate division NC10 bacterium]